MESYKRTQKIVSKAEVKFLSVIQLIFWQGRISLYESCPSMAVELESVTF